MSLNLWFVVSNSLVLFKMLTPMNRLLRQSKCNIESYFNNYEIFLSSKMLMKELGNIRNRTNIVHCLEASCICIMQFDDFVRCISLDKYTLMICLMYFIG